MLVFEEKVILFDCCIFGDNISKIDKKESFSFFAEALFLYLNISIYANYTNPTAKLCNTFSGLNIDIKP